MGAGPASFLSIMPKISPFANVSLGRVAAVTGSLALLGAVASAGVVVVLQLGLGLVIDRSLLTLRALAGGAGVGALCGAAFGPAVSWTLLRAAPIGRAVIETSVGAAVGVAAAIAIPVVGLVPVFGIALAGAIAAAVRLRFATGRARKSIRDGSPSS
jgi:hypothetical protein